MLCSPSASETDYKANSAQLELEPRVILAIQTVKLLVNYAFLIKSVKHAKTAVSGDFFGQNEDDMK